MKEGRAKCVCATCAVGQRRDRALLGQHALHTTGLFWMVEAEEVGLTQTQRVTWRENSQINTH